MNNVERVKSVYFELYSKELGKKVITEPKGWNEDFLEFQKDKDSKDIIKKIEIDLGFFGTGSSYLQSLYYGHGVFPNCLILKYEKSSSVNSKNGGVEETWDLVYVQRIDLKTFDIDRGTGEVKVKAYEGGLHDLVKNRYDDEIDLLGEYSLDGDYIGPLITDKFQATERKISLRSLLKGDYDRYRIGTGYWDSEEEIHSGRPIPLDIVYKSDGAGDIQQPRMVDAYYNQGRAQSAPADPVVGAPVGSDLPVFFEAEEPKKLQLFLKGSFKITEFEERSQWGMQGFYVRYVKSSRGTDGVQVLKEYEDILGLSIDSNVGVIHEINWSKTVDLEEGESISLIYATVVGISSGAFSNGYANTWVNSNMALTIVDITEYAPVERRCVKPFNLFDRILAKITGKTGLLRSTTFGPGGDFEFKVVDNGFFARGFPNKYLNQEGEEIKIQFKTSFKKAYEAFSAITPMCWITQKEGKKEVIRIEPEKYSLGNFVGVVIDNATDIKEKCSATDQFSKIELGHDGSLEYEEVNGLDEANGLSAFATHLGVSVNKTYSKVSPYRFDPMGYEFTRRLYFERFPHTDSKRDEHIWVHDAKLVGGVIMHRNWQDDFEAPPQGIFDPESVWNLRHSPMNLLYRGHGYAVRRCLYHDTFKFIRFSGSNANQNLVTFVDGLRLEESGQIQINKLEKQRIKADLINMTLTVTPEIRKQLEGTNEQGVKNILGLIQYEDTGVKKYGRIVKLGSGENSKLELIKAGV